MAMSTAPWVLLHRIPLFLHIKQQVINKPSVLTVCVMRCDKHLYIFRDASTAHLPQEVIGSNYPVEKWLIVCCKHCECCWVYVGLPQCAHHEHICFDLGLKLSQQDMKEWDSSFHVPSRFIAIFHLICLSKMIRTGLSSDSYRTVQGHNHQANQTQTHISTLFAPKSKQLLLWWWHL